MPQSGFRASAPGKLMLFGEHAVVFGRPCLVTTVGLHVSATVQLSDAPWIEIASSSLAPGSQPYRVPVQQAGTALKPDTAFVEAVAARALALAGRQSGLVISTHGPALSYGLGSSSAVTVAAAAAIGAALGIELDRPALFQLCHRAVLDAQGKGSGFDVAAAIYGGTIRFQHGDVEQLPDSALPLLIGYSGAKVSTRRFVDGVGNLRSRNPALVDGMFDMMAAIVESAQAALTTGNWAQFGDLADINQGLLDALGVNTPPLARLVFAAREAGALGAKLSGAGGGDCMFAVTGERPEAVAEALRSQGELVELPLGVPGVQVAPLSDGAFE